MVAQVPPHSPVLRGEFLGANLFSPQDLPTLMRKAHDLAFGPGTALNPREMECRMTTIAPEEIARLKNALPFWLSLGTVPMALLGMAWGGWAVFLMPLYTWGLYAVLDAILGLNTDNADLETGEDDLYWYRFITMAWFPLQFVILLLMLWYVPQAGHLNIAEKLALFFGLGVMSGTIGIVYAHELMHQKDPVERWLGDLLLASVLYSHFRSEHLRVHHLYVGTPRDPVTARYGEGFHRYFLRVLQQCPPSAWRAEAAMLARKGKGPFTPKTRSCAMPCCRPQCCCWR